MKKTFSKIISAILVLALALGAMSFNVFAAEETTVEIISNNILYSDNLKLMYAVDAKNTQLGDQVVLEIFDKEGQPVKVVDNGDVDIYQNGQKYPTFVSAKGVAAQDIADEFTAVAKVVRGGEVVATSATTTYSVLEYLYERSLVTTTTTEDERNSYKALYAYAKSLEVLPFVGRDKADMLDTYAYVRVAENGAFNGKTAGMVKVGTTLAELTSTLDTTDKYLVWDVVTYNANFAETDADTLSDSEAKALVAAPGAIILTPGLTETDPDEPLTKNVELILKASEMGIADTKPVGEYAADENITFIGDKGSHINSVPVYYANGTALRIYKGNTFTISAVEGAITQVVITASGTSYDWDSANTVTGGTAKTNGLTTTITANPGATEIVITLGGSNQRWSQIEVYYTIVE